MLRPSHTSLMSALVLVLGAASALAAQPGEMLLPATTKALIAVPDLEQFRAKWNETQLGKLAKDPIMKPFADDLRRQIKEKLSQTGVRLGLTLEDLQGVHGGEVCLAVIQPEGDKTKHAMAILADVTGHTAELKELREKIAAQMLARGAKRSHRTIRGVDVTVFVVPLKDAERTLTIYQFLVDNQYVAVDHLGEAEAILARLSGERDATLADAPEYRASMERVDHEAGDKAPHVRWFVEPFGYSETIRAAAGGKRRRGTDVLAVLLNQGFGAVRGIAGHITLADGTHELLYRLYIYAPPTASAEQIAAGEKYQHAARMLQFPSGGGLTSQRWIPRNVASYVSFNWKMKEAFEYSKSLVDELAGDEVFEEVIQGIKLDPKGPRVDVRSELIAHLGRRATIITDNTLPVTPRSQRMMFAIELTNPEAVARTVDRAMEVDPNAEKRTFNGHIIWEMVEKDTGELAVNIDAPPGLGFDEGVVEEKKEDRPIIPHSAVAVANGHLLFATHINFIRDLLSETADHEKLTEAADYAAINQALDNLGGGDDSFRLFVRSDEAYLPGYELLRQGKMADAETLLGRLLNAALAPDEEGAKREQQIDGSKMPEFEVVRRYLGPAGAYVKTEDNGWFAAGCLLSKDAE